jgi:hypothetical protein
MAHFFLDSGSPHARPNTSKVDFIHMSTGQAIRVGMWGANVQGQYLTVSTNDPSMARVQNQLANTTTIDSDGNLRNVSVLGLRSGSAMLEARLGPGGPVWGYTQLVIRDSAPKPGAPTVGEQHEWFVTGLNISTFSAILSVGVSALAGTIEFTNANGDRYSHSIGMVGPSIGLSYTPNLGGLLSRNPVIARALGRYPRLAKIITADEGKFEERVLLYLWAKSPQIRAAITKLPFLKPLLDQLLYHRSSLSAAGASWPSAAIGVVIGHGKPLTRVDFSGQCVCYSVAGMAGPGNVGTYVLFFGVDRSWSPVQDPLSLVDLMKLDAKSRGVAVIAGASLSFGLPALGAGATAYFGEII